MVSGRDLNVRVLEDSRRGLILIFRWVGGGERYHDSWLKSHLSTHSLGDRTGKLAIHSCLHVRYGFDALFGIAEEKGAIETLIRLCA